MNNPDKVSCLKEEETQSGVLKYLWWSQLNVRVWYDIIRDLIRISVLYLIRFEIEFLSDLILFARGARSWSFICYLYDNILMRMNCFENLRVRGLLFPGLLCDSRCVIFLEMRPKYFIEPLFYPQILKNVHHKTLIPLPSCIKFGIIAQRYSFSIFYFFVFSLEKNSGKKKIRKKIKISKKTKKNLRKKRENKEKTDEKESKKFKQIVIIHAEPCLPQRELQSLYLSSRIKIKSL